MTLTASRETKTMEPDNEKNDDQTYRGDKEKVPSPTVSSVTEVGPPAPGQHSDDEGEFGFRIRV